MEKRTFSLKGSEYIELNNLLKMMNLVNSGGEAKVFINQGIVQVNGEVDTRKRKKLRPGEVVLFNGNEITITE